MSREILFCPICQSPFGASKIPRLLPQCKHTLCQTCLQLLLQNQQSSLTIKCPIDHQEMEIQDRSIHHFPKNFSLIKSLEKRNSGALSSVRSRTSLFSEGDSKEKESSNTILQDSNKNIQKRQQKKVCSMKSDLEIENANQTKVQEGKEDFFQLIVIDMIQKLSNNIASKIQEQTKLQTDPSSKKEETFQKQQRLSEDITPKATPNKSSKIQNPSKKPPKVSNSKLNKKDSINQTSKITKDKNSSSSSLGKQDICLGHDKPLDVVCIKDQKLICSACALFGDHKGHEIKSLNEIRKDILDRQRTIIKLIQEKQIVFKEVGALFSDSALLKLINDKKDKVARQIQQHIHKVMNKLMEEEKKCMTTLDKEADQLFKILKKESTSINSSLEQIRNCQSRSLQILQVLESDISLEKKIPYLNYSKKIDFVDKISTSLSQIKELKKAASDKNYSLINKFNIKFKTPDFKNTVVFYKQRTSLEIAYQPILNQVNQKSKIIEDNIQEELLIDLEKDKVFQVNNSNLYSNSPSNSGLGWSVVLNQSMAFDATKTLSSLPVDNSMIRMAKSPTSKLLPKKVSSITPKSMLKSNSKPKLLSPHVSPRVLRSLSKVSCTSDGFSKSKSKSVKFKLSQKYQKIYNNLCLDSLQILDLTFAQLGNESVLYILQQLQNKKVKVIKLVRNKLSDEILKQMWKNMKHIQSLNLSQNNFSDKIIDSFMKNLPKLESMKSLTLSQNKISARAVKTQVDEIKKWGLTISL